MATYFSFKVTNMFAKIKASTASSLHKENVYILYTCQGIGGLQDQGLKQKISL